MDRKGDDGNGGANLFEERNIMCLREVNQNIMKSVTKNKREIVKGWNWEMKKNNMTMEWGKSN